MSTTTKKKTALNGAVKEKKMSKKEQELLALAEEVQRILAKHNVKPFNRKEFYASL